MCGWRMTGNMYLNCHVVFYVVMTEIYIFYCRMNRTCDCLFGRNLLIVKILTVV